MVHESFTRAQITEQVNKISSSSLLKNSPVLRQFLQFVVEETLVGNGERIKEYTIGTQVLGRKLDFDPQLDAIVRIHAGRLRRALNEFYSSEGKDDTMRISIPKGGYSAYFPSNGHNENYAYTTSRIPDKSTKPVVAVMPFRNISNDAWGDSFCQGLGEFASTELACFKELSLISYSSCLNAASKTKDIREMSSLVGAEYILTGSIYIGHHDLRVLLQLTRGDSGKQLWSNTFERKVTEANLFEIQQEIVTLITGSLGGYYGVIYRDVVETLRRSADYHAYSAIVWYDQFLKHLDKNTFDQACEALEDAVRGDPEYALAWAVLGEIYCMGVMMGFLRRDDQMAAAIKSANLAVKLDPLCQHAYQALARTYVMMRNKAGAVAASEKCIALNPRAANFTARIGVFMIYVGEYERGANILKTSLHINPYFPWMSAVALSLYHFHRNEFHESKEWAEKVDMPQMMWAQILKVAALAQLGEMEEAKREIDAVLVQKPDLTILGRTYIGNFILDEDLIDKIIASLEKTGLRIGHQEVASPVNR